jgi:hypothetical protein
VAPTEFASRPVAPLARQKLSFALQSVRWVISTNMEIPLTDDQQCVISMFLERMNFMRNPATLFSRLLTILGERPPAPCCAAAIHWASFR